MAPLATLIALWGFAAKLTLGDALDLSHVRELSNRISYPAGALGSTLQQERRASMVYLGKRDSNGRDDLQWKRIVTNQQIKSFRQSVDSPDVRKDASPRTKQLLRQLITRLNALHGVRRSLDNGTVRTSTVYTAYNRTVATVNNLQSSLSTLSDPVVAKDYQTQLTLSRGREALSQEDATVANALASGRLSVARQHAFTKLVGVEQNLYQQASSGLSGEDRNYYKQILRTPQYRRLRSLEDRLMRPSSTRGRPPVSGSLWKATSDSVLTRLRGLELSTTDRASKRSQPVANGIILRLALAGIVGLAVVALSIFLSFVILRSVLGELTGLRNSAWELANDRMPRVIRRLRHGEPVDASAEAPPLAFRTPEINQVGRAFNEARVTAIQTAVQEAELRRSVNSVFVNLARRNQALLHRQLKLLDEMEEHVTEPDELEDLFRLDHLATRMRRHAEGLIILSGSAPGRGWRHPVSAVDVARAAVSEVESYTRVSVLAMPSVAVTGPAVADVIHLLAELIENATMFSPPETAVTIAGHTVARGFVIEIEDRGLSMEPAELERANATLADPPEFHIADNARLGLFVVGRLARRHNIKVSLRTSPYGGTTAIVLLPSDVMAPIVEETTPEPERVADGQAATSETPEARGQEDTGESVLTPSVPPARHAHEESGADTDYDDVRPAFEPRARYADTTTSAEAAVPFGSGTSRPHPNDPQEQDTQGRPKLPTRTRQASLSPELQAEPVVTEEVAYEEAVHSPETYRSMLSSMQSGWLRGRSEAEGEAADGQSISPHVAEDSVSEEDER